MKYKPSALAGVFAVLAILALDQFTFSQNNSGPNTTTRLVGLEAELNKLLETDENDTVPAPSRPRVVNKVSDVKASVVVNTTAVGKAVFDLMNQKRVENGQRPLQWSDQLATAAS